MKKQYFSSFHIYLILLLCLIALIYIQSINSKNINENFKVLSKTKQVNDSSMNKVNLSCNIGSDNKYNCTKSVPEKVIKEKVIIKQENVLFETGIGPESNTGKINFKKKFSKIPSIYCTSLINEKKPEFKDGKLKKEENEIIPSINISVYNVTNSSFEYKKTKIDSNDEFNGMLVIEKDNKYKFNWMAISEPISDKDLIKKL